MEELKWSYGVTCVPERMDSVLVDTLESLAAGGFERPRLFVDGERAIPERFSGYEMTVHRPRLRTFGNWVLALWELYVRRPDADRYALFQDDMVCYRNLRQYLERCPFPSKGYLNLYLFPQNEKLAKGRRGWYQSNQLGKGAVALVFDNEGARLLLGHPHMVDRPLDERRGWKSIDGGIVTAFKKAKWKEYVHNPSLVQHTGTKSSMGNKQHPKADSFLGQDFDALAFVEGEHRIPQVHTEGKRRTRIGLVGYNCSNGLGEMNWQMATYCEVEAWLVKPHRKLPLRDPHPDVDTIVCPSGTDRKIEQFLAMVDVVVFAETPYYGSLIEMAANRGKRIVCVPMMEWMPSGGKGWPKSVDLFLCPTQQCYNLFYRTVPCVEFQWPADSSRFPYRERETCERFLFVNGMGGFRGRKGLETVREAKRIWPEMPLLVRSQSRVELPGAELLPAAEDNVMVYDRGDVLLVPSAVDGLGLSQREGMACGMPVITTDGEPWNELPALDRIPASVKRQIVKRPVDWYMPDARSLTSICRKWHGRSITQQSQEARMWAEQNRWQGRAAEFHELVRSGRQRLSLPFTPKDSEVAR